MLRDSLANKSRREVDHAVRELLGDVDVGFVRDDGGGGGSISAFTAKVMTAGPNAEADYTDGRYWVQEVDDTSTSETVPLVLTPVPVSNGGRWVTAHNRVEYGIGIEGTGTHAIVKSVGGITVPARYVKVFLERFKTSGVRYVFESYPGQMQTDMYAWLKTTCLTGQCPNGAWFKMTGPGIVSQEVPPQCS